MKLLGNIIWLIFGGLHTAIEYFIAGLVLMITIIGIPFGLQSMKLGVLAIWPFGSKVKWKESQPGCLSMFMNVLWFFVGGIWICLTHIFYGLLLCITILAGVMPLPCSVSCRSSISRRESSRASL